METRFYTTQSVNDSGDPTTILHKAVFDDGLDVYIVADSADAGKLFLTQQRSPFHRDSADGPFNEDLGIQKTTIVEYNRAWDSADEAFNWFKGGLV